MHPDAIQYYNRYTQRVEAEQIYGEGFLRWIYGSLSGRLALHAVAKRGFFSRWYGWRMDRAASRAKVAPFIQNFRVDPGEFADAPESFRTFNEFFYRKLKPGARLIAGDARTAVFPADGRHLGFADVSRMEGIFVKGAVFSLGELLRDCELAEQFQRGSMVLSRLCPVDYHRYHFPVGGLATEPRLVNGWLYSVSPIALRRNIRIFTENKRAITRIESPEFGTVLMLEVGATNVGSFEYTFTPNTRVAKGAEKGYFKFGGSSTITLFEPGRVKLDADLLVHTAERRELYARMGDRLGVAA
ncbi:MAG: phosphatidylserine decarboxylase [Pedosphaera sp.]|nr:phosphatidylserine decarboxylase [Pedosphaera sp.]PHX95173.1 MAG: phosphatidylserine decarboxylase [Pedosphaera sp.]